jgi:hypothetical protein
VVERPEKEETSEKSGSTSSVRTVDFYNNPTILSRLILNQKYSAALKRLYMHLEEASIWVCARRKGSTQYSIRQLPIHVACANLRRTHDSKLKKLLNELIATLIFAFPGGVDEPDHQGYVPIHEAVWHGAFPQTISLFFMAKPSLIHYKDSSGRTLADLNRYRSGEGKKEMSKVLSRRIEFWELARQKAKLKMKHSTLTFPSETGSSSPSEASRSSDERLVTSESSEESEEVASISWEQLEVRAIAAEQVLTEMNEKNYDLNRRIEVLTAIDRAQGKKLAQEIARLNGENAELISKLHNIEWLLQKTILTGDEAKDVTLQTALAELSSLPSLSEASYLSEETKEEVKPLEEMNQRLANKAASLSRRQGLQRENIRKLKWIISDLLLKSSSKLSIEGSTISPLSNNTASTWSGAIPEGQGARLVDKTPEDSRDDRERVDDLDVIFRYAAARDLERRAHQHQASPALDTAPQKTDDLSELFRFAARREATHGPPQPPDRRERKFGRQSTFGSLEIDLEFPPMG